jgi:hypothetical protein
VPRSTSRPAVDVLTVRFRTDVPHGPSSPESPQLDRASPAPDLGDRDARLADLDQLTDEERVTITNVIDALVTKAKLRLITGGAG